MPKMLNGNTRKLVDKKEMTDSVRILLVDDEPPLLKLMQTYLARLGYSVEACPDARSAMAAFAREPSGFDLVVADVTLPDMSGQDMAVEMAERAADVRVLLCSGYPVQLTSVPAAVRDRFACLDKPFLPNMLASMVEKLVQQKKVCH
jgi:two-component system, cell cycle sensor histidine kinase and response regulator CckA